MILILGVIRNWSLSSATPPMLTASLMSWCVHRAARHATRLRRTTVFLMGVHRLQDTPEPAFESATERAISLFKGNHPSTWTTRLIHASLCSTSTQRNSKEHSPAAGASYCTPPHSSLLFEAPLPRLPLRRPLPECASSPRAFSFPNRYSACSPPSMSAHPPYSPLAISMIRLRWNSI